MGVNCLLVTLVEDDPELLGSLKIVLGGEPGIKVAAAYATAEEALAGLGTIETDTCFSTWGCRGRTGGGPLRTSCGRGAHEPADSTEGDRRVSRRLP